MQKHSHRGYQEVHEYSGRFQGQSAHFKMTSVIGHVLSIDFPAKFQNWSACASAWASRPLRYRSTNEVMQGDNRPSVAV